MDTGRRFGKISSPSSALKIPVGMHIAHSLAPGGDAVLLREVLDIIRQAGKDGAFAMHRGPRGEVKDLYHWARMYSYCQDHPELSSLQDWPTLIAECWRAGKSTVLDERGLCIGQGDFLADGTIAKYSPGPIDDVHHGYWMTDAPNPPSSAQMACLAMLMFSRDGGREAAEIGRRLLSALTTEMAVVTPHNTIIIRHEILFECSNRVQVKSNTTIRCFSNRWMSIITSTRLKSRCHRLCGRRDRSHDSTHGRSCSG